MLGAFLFIFMGQTTPPSSDTVTENFCARLATRSGIEKPAESDGRTEWTADAANFGQRFLFGGSFTTAVGVAPVEPATLEEYRRLENMCLAEGKGAMCKLDGPLDFSFTWRGRKIVTPMSAGERATILVAGSKTTCRAGPAISPPSR